MIPGCAGDIFASYAPADDAQQWVSATFANLKSYLEVYYRTKGQFPAWRLDAECTPAAIAAVLIVLSRNSLRSGWCNAENRKFLERIHGRVQAG